MSDSPVVVGHTPRLSIDISQTLVFVVVFISLAVLVGLGKVAPDKLELLLMVLIPSPVKKDQAS